MSKANEMASKAENETIVALCPYTEIIERKNNNKVKRIERIGIDNIY
jgi:hypothetical protein